MDKKESAILIDSDVLVNFFDNHKSFYDIAIAELKNIKSKSILTCISIITTIEILQGSKKSNEKTRIAQELIPFEEIGISEAIGGIAKQLIITYSSSHGLLLADAFIAATALHLDIPLFTFNKKDFKFIKDLKLYEPS